MANSVNYVTKFADQLLSKYAVSLRTSALTSQGANFLNAKTVEFPYLTLGGLKDHGRNGGFNRQNAANESKPFTLTHDRDAEFFIDTMDEDETNRALAAANLTNVFEEQQVIPEIDSYRLSKMYQDYIAPTIGNKTADATVLTAQNILSVFDNYMQQLDDAGVPSEGRILYITPATYKLLKQADAISRSVTLTPSKQAINRGVYSIDDVTIEIVPAVRMKTAYDYTDGCVPAEDAGQMNMILVHPSAVIAVNKHSYIRLFAPGTHTQGDGYLYQYRQYWDLFVIGTRADAIAINVTPAPEEDEPEA